jgi:hypothetical protein
MSYYNQHQHLENIRGRFRSGNSAQSYGAVVGTPQLSQERSLENGPSGDHLQFYLDAGAAGSFQVDVNTQSRDGSEIGIYIAEETLAPAADATDDNPFGAEALGPVQNAALSYEQMGLANRDFTQLSDARIEDQLRADLGTARFVAAYGMMFNDGGANGKGIHETHFNPTAPAPDQDGALALYTFDTDGKTPKRVWYFFKFQTDAIA